MILNNKRCKHEVCVLRLHRHLFAPERVSNRDEVIGYNQKLSLSFQLRQAFRMH